MSHSLSVGNLLYIHLSGDRERGEPKRENASLKHTSIVTSALHKLTLIARNTVSIPETSFQFYEYFEGIYDLKEME